jgi:hypothetical protein
VLSIKKGMKIHEYDTMFPLVSFPSLVYMDEDGFNNEVVQMEVAVQQRSEMKEQAHMSARKAKASNPTPAKGKRGRKPPPPNETRRQAFLRIGNGRTLSALDGIRLIGNLARGAYDWSMDDVEHIEAALKQQIGIMVEEFKKALEPPPVKETVDFSLADRHH